jgi:hypothetical protein
MQNSLEKLKFKIKLQKLSKFILKLKLNLEALLQTAFKMIENICRIFLQQIFLSLH